jgi:16S rRNA (uracil1498-N3)-methyltransferase
MSERFYSSRLVTGDYITLDGPEAHHLLHVMRAKVGAAITVFDGSGAEFEGAVDTLKRAEAGVRIVERREIDRELPFSLIVGVALPKGDRQKWLVEKLTEVGVAELVPLVTERGVAQPTESATERLERTVIEAAKQCERNRLMKIAPSQQWAEFVRAAKPQTAVRLLAHPGGASFHDLPLPANTPITLAVGPEGGLTEDEVATAIDAGWRHVSLGPRILRVETAAIALAGMCALRSK